MKSIIKNFIAAGITATVILGTTFAAQADSGKKMATVLPTLKNFRKISVSGNVELILIQDAEENVKVYNDYYANNALVQQNADVLRISSFGKEKLTVMVHVKNLYAIEAQDHASVKTYGSFNLLGLDVVLHDQATADINANTVSLTTMAGEGTQLRLAGTTDNYTAKIGDNANLNLEGFTAQNTSISSQQPQMVKFKSSETQAGPVVLAFPDFALN